MNPYKIGNTKPSLTWVGVALCLLASPCAAQSSEPERTGIRISGFGTLGLVHAQAPTGWGFLRSLEQPPSSRNTRVDTDSRLGVQLNYAANSQIELVGQVLATRRRAGAPAGDAVEWAFAAYRPTADLTLRAGRLNLDQFVLSDFRNVGFAYLSARPPVEYYGSIPSNLDGADVTRSWRSDDVRWQAKGFVGRSKASGVPLTHAFGVALTRESDGLLVRAGWSRAKLAHNSDSLAPLFGGLDQLQALQIAGVSDEAAALHGALDLAAEPITYATLGMAYEQGPWQTAAEVTRIMFGRANIVAGYASIGRRIGEVTLFGMVSSVDSDSPALASPTWGASLAPVIGPAAAQQAQQLGAAAAYAASQSTRQSTFSLGARWEFHPRMALKAQWDHVKIRANGGFLWASASGDPGSANVTTVLLDFVF